MASTNRPSSSSSTSSSTSSSRKSKGKGKGSKGTGKDQFRLPTYLPLAPPSVTSWQVDKFTKLFTARNRQLTRLSEVRLRTLQDLSVQAVNNTLHAADTTSSTTSSTSSTKKNGTSRNTTSSSNSRSKKDGRLNLSSLILPLHHTIPSTSLSSTATPPTSPIATLLQENILTILTKSFWICVDSRRTQPQRDSALRIVRDILGGIDAQRRQAVVGPLREEVRRWEERGGGGGREAQKQQNQQGQDKERRREKDKERRGNETSGTGGRKDSATVASTETARAANPQPAQQGKQQTAPANHRQSQSESESNSAGGRSDKDNSGSKESGSGSGSNKQNMGQLLSTAKAAAKAAAAADDGDGDDSDDSVIILDGPPTPPPGGRPERSRPLPPPQPQPKAEEGAAAAAAAAAAAGGGGGGSNSNSISGTAAANGTSKAAARPEAAPRPRFRQTASCPVEPHTVTAQADTVKPRYSASLDPRPRCRVTIDQGRDPTTGTQMDEATLDGVRSRLAKWDPYWDCVHEFSTTTSGSDGGRGTFRDREWAARTGPVSKYEEIGKRVGDLAGAERYEIAAAGSLTFQVGRQDDSAVHAKLSSLGRTMTWGRAAGEKNARTYVTGDRRCLLRMMPLYRTDAERAKFAKKRADTHLWPVGTFLQINNRPVSLLQRKQQSHDHALWKGMCHALDVTTQISDARVPNTVEVLTRDGTQYAIHLAVCDYVGPDELFLRLMKPVGPRSIRRYEYDEALKIALDYVKNQMVVLDSDDDGEGDDGAAAAAGNGASDASQTYSLLCPLSMSAMQTPVRGVNCRHMACFDLRNWLHNNVTVGGTRWRCGHCEDFIAPSDLVLDGMFSRFLEKHRGDVSSARDKIQLHPDGTWNLMDANKLRYQNKRSSSNMGGSESDAKRTKIEPGAPDPPLPSTTNGEVEIIELDLD